jgi:hypothetical protein
MPTGAALVSATAQCVGSLPAVRDVTQSQSRIFSSSADCVHSKEAAAGFGEGTLGTRDIVTCQVIDIEDYVFG